ncbi:MAG: exopolysaccharide biosynthesis polyprenyl glycosylphosphotransferase [Candidatus Latescibacterota bacterium]|jgi:exopolysaccharide biosynthesis polyprenyl glycosylphosphotransferase
MKQTVGFRTKGNRAAAGAIANINAAPQIEVNGTPMYAFFKRVFDIVVGTAILILLIPILPLIALMIKLDSRGPVFFKQVRVGENGKLFKFYKFRSMVHRSDTEKDNLAQLNEQDGPVFKIRSDPRVTSVGRFLRRSSLDEIPQMFNVMKGDMSMVGPRPPLPEEVTNYQPWHMGRLAVKPGITCLWQISGRSHIGFNEWMRLDMEYLKTRSFKTDLLIFLKTIPAVIARKGAY